MASKILVIACGAIARELLHIRDMNQWQQLEVQCLPAELHNTPDKIPSAIKARLDAAVQDYSKVFVAYADCGTGGLLDSLLQPRGIERIPGAHCYEFFAGSEVFHQYADAEPGSFYLTDFLVRHFERLVVRGLGLDRQPQLMPLYFGNYKRLVFLAQTDSGENRVLAQKHADYLGLEYHYCFCGSEPFTTVLTSALEL